MEGRKPTLEERLAALAERATPTPSPVAPPVDAQALSREDAVAYLQETLGAVVLGHYLHTPDGGYLDTRTKVVHDVLPRVGNDGHPV